MSMPIGLEGGPGVETINEEDELRMQQMLKLVDKDGKTIELSAE